MIAILTTLSTIQCPHGGTLTLSTANTLCQIDGGYALLLSDVHGVTGCLFQKPPPSGVGLVPSPCVRVQWTSGAAVTKVNNVGVLLQTSSGICFGPDQLPQGPPIISQVQSKAKGQ